MEINENAKKVLAARYLIKGEDGKPIETCEELFSRVADAIAASDLKYDTNADVKRLSGAFYKMMTKLDFLPNSPTLMNAGRPLGQLSACFVLPVEDTMEDIFEAVKQAALIHKSGGGTGFSFSRLRPKGSAVNSTGGVASGPISFMKVFNTATEAVKQGGTRRGANMGILRVDHPDILEFIDCKRNTGEINNFNISIGITDKFMQAVEAGEDYELIDPHKKVSTGTLPAGEVFDKIVDAAWQNGEPGIVFLDRINRCNAVPAMGEIESTNPCGEQPLLPYESCNLGSVNLSNMVTAGGEVDWERLETTVELAVRFLDNVIDANKYPMEKIEETTKSSRKIGLGIMGFADMLLKLKISYCSDAGVQLAGRIMRTISDKARDASERLANERGVFPRYEDSVHKGVRPQRNATVTTIAPTGTLSIIAGVSSGIEPVFGYVFIRNVMDGTEMIEVNPVLKAELMRRGLYKDELMKKIAKEGSVAHIDEIPADIREVYVAAHDVSPEWHIRMQAAFQQYTDNAVSKTVNFPNSAEREDVAKVYMLAYTLGCKGVTIYRDGSRSEQVLNIGKVNKKTEQSTPEKTAVPEVAETAEKAILRPRKRPAVTAGMTERMKIGCGNLYVTVNYDDKGICEVFTNTGKAGGCPSQSEATARLVSIALRAGVDPDSLIDELRGIRCPSTIRLQATHPEIKAISCPDAMARVIRKVYDMQNGRPVSEEPCDTLPVPGIDSANNGPMHKCPECGAKLEHEGGCVTCRSCGFSKCG